MDMPISLGFLSGAIVMVLGNVMTIEEAYEAVEWKVVFLIAGLIPIGIAMEKSGAASMIAEGLVGSVSSIPAYFILLFVGLLTTGFSLIMSNVAATVLLVPLSAQHRRGRWSERPGARAPGRCVRGELLHPFPPITSTPC